MKEQEYQVWLSSTPSTVTLPASDWKFQLVGLNRMYAVDRGDQMFLITLGPDKAPIVEPTSRDQVLHWEIPMIPRRSRRKWWHFRRR